jgi:hypothetical protein
MNIDNIIKEEIARLNETAGKNMPDTFFDRIVQKLGGTPTEEKRKFFRSWKRAEGTDAKNNPLATTLKLKTSHGGSTDMKGSVNKGQPVQDYKTLDAGVDATYWTLKNTYGGKAYQNLVNKLKSNDVTAAELAAEKEELALWSSTAPTGHYVSNIQKGVGADYTSASEFEASPENPPVETGLDISDEEIAKSFQQTSLDRMSDKKHEEQLDKIQRYLDYGGFIPFIGDAVDALNGVLYFARNKPMEGILSFIAIIPGVGSAIAVPLKLVLRSIKAVPKIAFLASKNGVSWLSKNIFKNPLFTKLVLKKYGPTSLKQVLDAGEPFLRALNDLPTKLNGIPIINRLASPADQAAKVFDNFLQAGRKTYDDMLAASGKLGSAAQAPAAASILNTLKKYTLKLGRVKLNKIFGGKTIDAFVKLGPNNLDKILSKNIINKIVTRVARNPEAFQQLLRQVDFDIPAVKNEIKKFLQGVVDDPYLSKLYTGTAGSRLTQGTVDRITNLSGNDIKRILGDSRLFNSKFRKRFLEEVTEGRTAASVFDNFNDVFRKRAGIQAEREMANIANFFRGVDVRQFFLGRRLPNNPNFWQQLGKLGENINAPKILTKAIYILQDFEKMQFVQEAEVENPNIKALFEELRGLVYKIYANKFYQIPGFLSDDELDEINDRYKDNLQNLQKIQSLIANDIASGKEDYTEGDLKALELAAELTE